MKKNLLCCVLLAAVAPLSSSCKRVIEPGPEVLESFAVTFNFDSEVLAAAGCGSSLPDTCLHQAGSSEQPLPYVHQQYVSVFLDIEAIGSRGTRPFAWSGELGLRMARGRLHSQLAPVQLVDGVARAVQVRLQRAPGRTAIFVEDRIEGRNAEAPTFAMAASPPLFFDQPTVAQVQETRDESTGPLYANNVEISHGTLVVTHVSGGGFYLQDIDAGPWGGLYVYTYGNPEGVTHGSVMTLVKGTVSEFLGSTQVSFPEYGGPYTHCETHISQNEGVEDTEVDVGITLSSSGCPPDMTCKGVQIVRDGKTYSQNRCVPDDPGEALRYDTLFGRIICNGANDNTSCPAGMRCLKDSEKEAYYCQVEPVPMPLQAWPATRSGFPYCGPYHTDRESPLLTESYESRLVTLRSADSAQGLRVEGLPVCKKVDDINAVRSTCNLDDSKPDCTLARAGEPLLRDAKGEVCARGYQACKDTGVDWNLLRSTCNADPSLDYCEPALPGDTLLRNDAGQVCRSTMDDFIMGGFESFGQWKVTFRDANDDLRCATVVGEALTGFDALDFQETVGSLSSITGTLKQTVFRSGSSFWIIEPRGMSDLEF